MALPVYPSNIKFEWDLDMFRILELTRKSRQTEFEDGPDLKRRSGLSRRAVVACSIAYPTLAEYAIWHTFYEDTLIDGTLRFTMPVWRPSTGIYEPRTVLIDGDASAQPHGISMRSVMTLQIYNW